MSTSATSLARALGSLAYGGDPVSADPLESVIAALRDADPSEYESAPDPLARLWGNEPDLALALVLHGIGASEQAVLSHHVSATTFREMETRVAPEFWKRAKIDPTKLQRSELCAVLGREVRETERRLDALLSDQVLASPISSVRNDYARLAKDPRTTAVVGGFSIWRTLDATIHSVFADAAKVDSDPTLESFERWERKWRTLDEQLGDAGLPFDSGLQAVFRALRHKLSTMIDSLGLREPADLVVSAVLRRLPLHIADQPFKLPLLIENRGKGVAVSPKLRIEISGRAGFDETSVSLGDRLESGTSRIDLAGVVRGDDAYPFSGNDECLVALTWLDWRGQEQVVEEVISIEPQRAGIDWAQLETRNPYDLEPVRSQSELFGREGLLNQLLGAFRSPGVGSAFILGHKRVGKTSLAYAVLERLNEDGVVGVIRDTGSIHDPDPSKSIDNLVRRWIRQLRVKIPELADLPEPVPTGALSCLQNYLEDALDVMPTMRVVLALDEFDRLPGALLRRTPAGESFFASLRSITSLPGVGLLLIGGEAMRLVLTGPGGELNKPTTVQVDTIDRASHWSDFVELVRSPVSELIEVTDGAVEAVYRWSNGNPYFAKNILQRVYATAVAKRHDEVIEDEIDAAAYELSSPRGGFALTANSFAHYWEDYLLTGEEDADLITLNRRRTLLALADVLRGGGAATTEGITDAGVPLDLDPDQCAQALVQFRERGLLDQTPEGLWSTTLPIFQQWLVERGRSDITLDVGELRTAAATIERDRKLTPDYLEVQEWCRSERIAYRSSGLDAARVMPYLQQFNGGVEQRAVFELLRRVRFIRTGDVQAVFEDMHDHVLADLKRQGTWSRKEILLTWLDEPGKSQQSSARDYCEAASLATNFNIVSTDDLASRLSAGSVKAVIVADDFAGTGESLVQSLARLVEDCPGVRHVLTYVFVVAGFDTARVRIEKALEDNDLELGKVRFGEVLGDQDRALAPEAFTTEGDRATTAEILHRWGGKLEPKQPLGYGACQALVVFGRTTPNNSVPILWKRAKGFEPLFPRSRSR